MTVNIDSSYDEFSLNSYLFAQLLATDIWPSENTQDRQFLPLPIEVAVVTEAAGINAVL
jgi:hypothetical protein